MWGNPQGAAELNHPPNKNSNNNNNNRTGDLTPSAFQCKSRLIQISSPAHIPLQDIRWQELFLSYNILVHLDLHHREAVVRDQQARQQQGPESSLVLHIVRNMAKNAAVSSNLAGFTWHVVRMVDELAHSCRIVVQSEPAMTTGGGGGKQLGTNASRKISLIGQARVVCGALNLFRIVLHEALIDVCWRLGENVDSEHGFTRDDGRPEDEQQHEEMGKERYHESDIWEEIFSVRRGKNEYESSSTSDENMTKNLIRSLFAFLTSFVESKAMQKLVYCTPELYDATVFCLKLILVLFSTQLYSPMISSYQRLDDDGLRDASTHVIWNHYFLDCIMQEASTRSHHGRTKNHTEDGKSSSRGWTPKGVILSCLHWMMSRPPPPERSIAYQFQTMSDMIAKQVKHEKLGVDGMYETHTVVMANAPWCIPQWSVDENNVQDATDGKETEEKSSAVHDKSHPTRSSSDMILDSTKKVIHLSSALFLLPIRLLVVALRALRNSQKLLGGGKALDYDSKLAELQSLYASRIGSAVGNSLHPSLTNDVLWLSDSPIADLGASLFLILTNNHRAGVSTDNEDGCYSNNPFRVELASMDDNRWEGYSKTPGSDGYLGEATDIFETVDLSTNNSGSFDKSVHHYRDPKQNNLMTINFEHLFNSFGGTVHNEVGALVLYTLLQASPIFAASLAVRSDLDKLVLPLLRTLYYSTSISNYISGRTTVNAIDGNSVNVLEQPFRSRSQLYVIMILLLIFSQDASFGPDAFKRSNIVAVEWYKERKLKNISIGSVLILSMLRCITFNLNRLNDPFLLSNCCAVLLNLSPHAVELNSYTAFRLVSVLIATMKRYTILVMKNGGKSAEDGDVTSSLGMYAEACRILLQVVKHGVRRRVVDSNLDLVYSLAYNQREFNTIVKSKSSPFASTDTMKIQTVIDEAHKIIQQVPNQTAESSMQALRDHIDILKTLKLNKNDNNKSSRRKRFNSSSSSSSSSVDSSMSDSTMNGMEDFKFTYEEESDPEIFFIPYIWEVIVSTVTCSSLEWNKEHIQVFPIMRHLATAAVEAPDHETNAIGDDVLTTVDNHEFSKDVDDVV
eukprot:CAMPEP_0176480042 /NCGR_PEP_ID=MMETSP0200_2-20121128/2066_1 /TAXON_ID=947934 /ORGANISM="Chaetoceros sp., Strain GSL56" /LENGTH=1076 /DNA_ID=CAMNT_0017876135 /DNA_START=179 /DNA_END=3409 /DNA_ORIENTATION=+